MSQAISHLLLVQMLIAPVAAQSPRRVENGEIDTRSIRLGGAQPAQFESPVRLLRPEDESYRLGSGTKTAPRNVTPRTFSPRSTATSSRGATTSPRSSTTNPRNDSNDANLPPYASTSPSDGIIRVPMQSDGNAGTIRVSQGDNTITLFVRDASLHHVISLIAKASGMNIVITEQTSERISITLNKVPFQDALDAILSVGGYTSNLRNNILFVSKVRQSERMSAGIQGRIMEVFTLDYAAADDVQAAVQVMLSPAGTSSISRSDSQDHRRTRELVVVEDLPEVINRVRGYVERIDIPPRQVMIEAHILQVDLGDELRHGVNIQRLADIAGGDLSVEVRGFANGDAPQGFIATMDGNDVGAVIEALKTTSETKTLAAPKVLVVNGQDAHLQVGEQLAFRTTLTTQTATQETIQFLPIGVVLDVRPQISRDGRILMFVRPKVSSGRINPDSQLPEERKTEVETDVLLNDGEGLVIGGLIQETTSNDQSKVPLLGDIRKIGTLFQRKARDTIRSEIIVTLIPRIIPVDHDYGQPDVPPYYREPHRKEYERANTRLTRGSIYRTSRHHLEQPMVDACENGTRVRDLMNNSVPVGPEGLGSSGFYGDSGSSETCTSGFISDDLMTDDYAPNEYAPDSYAPDSYVPDNYAPIQEPFYENGARAGEVILPLSKAPTNRQAKNATSDVRRISHESPVNSRTNRPTRSVRLEVTDEKSSAGRVDNRYRGRLQRGWR